MVAPPRPCLLAENPRLAICPACKETWHRTVALAQHRKRQSNGVKPFRCLGPDAIQILAAQRFLLNLTVLWRPSCRFLGRGAAPQVLPRTHEGLLVIGGTQRGARSSYMYSLTAYQRVFFAPASAPCHSLPHVKQHRSARRIHSASTQPRPIGRLANSAADAPSKKLCEIDLLAMPVQRRIISSVSCSPLKPSNSVIAGHFGPQWTP